MLPRAILRLSRYTMRGLAVGQRTLQGVLPRAGRRRLERGRSARMLCLHVDQQRLVRDAGDRVAQRARARLRLGALDLPAPRPAGHRRPL